jgi:nucleotide-binding universal stress UspA family protein
MDTTGNARPSATATRPVVVGVDGSASSLAAAGYAAHLADLRAAPLDLICGFDMPAYGYTPIGAVDRYAVEDDSIRADIDTMLADTAKRLRGEFPGVPQISGRRRAGGGAAALIDESRRAAVTVVGCRGIGGFAELLLGSTSAQLATHAHGPVIVVRPPVPVPPGPEQPPVSLPPEGPIVVGVDRSPGAQAALRFAVEEARRRDATVIAVHAFPISRDESRDEVNRDDAAAQQIVSDAVSPWAHLPGITIETRTIASHNIAQTMIDTTRHAGLIVVGSRGFGGFAGLLLGSVSRALVHHAYRPVAVIHPTGQ